MHNLVSYYLVIGIAPMAFDKLSKPMAETSSSCLIVTVKGMGDLTAS